jgi:hypothetical protein
MKMGRGCECVMHKLASLQPIHAQKTTLLRPLYRELALLLSHLTRLKDEDRKDLRKA